MAEEERPKLIVDDDWKSQAAAEKEKLAQAEAEKAEAGGGARSKLPEADFRGLVGTLASQALLYLGGVADPRTGQAIFDPEYAKHMIDLLGLLEEKTKGNISEDEAEELKGVLTELRARFVQLIQAVATQQAGGATAGEGGAGPVGGAPPAGGAGAGGIITP